MSYEIDTVCIHGDGHRTEDKNCAISYPIYQTASFSHLTPGHNPSGFDYSRESNPTRAYLEETVSALEGACDTIAFSSGMAAISAVFEYFKPGDHIICGEDLYGGVVRLAAVVMSKIAKEAGALLIVDNTFMTPYFQNPLKLGADVVVHSGTKYLSGHNDTVCGFLCSKEQKLAEYFRLISKTTGATLGPFECWLCMRGLKTLAVRMERHQSNAMAIAGWLKSQECVEKVYFTGLEDNPGYEKNREQARGYSGMISFTVKSAELAQNILKHVKLITFAESLGGTESLLTYPAVQTHPDVPVEQREKLGITDKLLRLSVGIEDPGDLIADLKQAMER